MSDLPPFPTSLVGSLPRPRWLIQVLRDREQGNIPDIEWQMLAEYAVRDAVQIQEDAGVDIITDGEQRRDGFLTFVQDRLFGLRRMSLAERLRSEPSATDIETRLAQLDVPMGAIKSPVISDATRVLNPYKGIVLEEMDYLAQQTERPIRVSLPGPYTLSRTLWAKAHSKRVYDTSNELASDLLSILHEELWQLSERNVGTIQIDEPGFATLARGSSESAFSGAFIPENSDIERERECSIALINALSNGIAVPSLSLRLEIGTWSRSDAIDRSIDLDLLVPLLEAMNVDQVGLGLANLDDAGFARLGRLSASKSIELGVVSARADRVESPEEIVETVVRAQEHIPPERIHLTPDTGFAPFYERNLNTMETAQAKLESMVKAARLLRAM